METSRGKLLRSCDDDMEDNLKRIKMIDRKSHVWKNRRKLFKIYVHDVDDNVMRIEVMKWKEP